MQPAVFVDLEGTLIKHNVTRLSYKAAIDQHLLSKKQILSAALLANLAKIPGPQRLFLLGQTMLQMVAGLTIDEAEQLIAVVLPTLVGDMKSGMLDKIKSHQQQGYPVILITGVIQPSVDAIARSIGAHGEGTRIKLVNGRYTTQTDGGLCNQELKAKRAQEVMAQMDIDPASSYAYGDSAADIPYLSLFGHPIAIDPDPELASHANRCGWSTLQLT
jgi:HAD superfamily hydrolase (TIGR01490 family)